MNKTVLLSQTIDKNAVKLLADAGLTLVTNEGTDQAKFESLATDCDAIVLRTNVKVTGEMIRKNPRLKIIARTGVGVDNIDLAAAKECGVTVVNTPFANSRSVAEHAVAQMLALSKQLVLMDKKTREAGGWAIRSKNLAFEVEGKTVGIVGLGNIGRITAQICHAGFGMKILASDPYADPALYPDYRMVDLETLFAESDFVSLHCPATPETKGLVGERLLSLMKPTALLINCARGEVIDSAALCTAIRAGRPAGAALDVFAPEPVAIDDALLTLPNVIVSPHIAALTQEAGTRMSMQACEQVIQFFGGQTPAFVYPL